MDNSITSSIKSNITDLKNYWSERNKRFREWYELLTLVDVLAAKGLESYVSNDPQTFYNMAHYLLTKGELSHTTPIENESASELDRKARVNRACKYMWNRIDESRVTGGDKPFIDDLGFFLLVLGWEAVVALFDEETGMIQTQIWNPYDTYPQYADGHLVNLVHSYSIGEMEANMKATNKNWNYIPRPSMNGTVQLDDYFSIDCSGNVTNMVLLNGEDVTGIVQRPNMKLIISPVGGFSDRGSLSPRKKDWRRLLGRGIFEVNAEVGLSFNKWKTMVNQILRDSAQSLTQEFSATPQATPEQIRERGGHFHYSMGEKGLERIPPGQVPPGLLETLSGMSIEKQKGSFNDAVYGMVNGEAGYALSLLATSSANQILYPYMDSKHFVTSQIDKFWLSNLKTTRRVFEVKGMMIEKLKPTDIPEDVTIKVESDVATPKDWLERSQIANQLKDTLDESTIMTEVLRMNDPQSIKRRRSMDLILNSATSVTVQTISGYYEHADYLDFAGDTRQANLFRKAAQSLEATLGIPPAGSGSPATELASSMERKQGAPQATPGISPEVAPPETSGFSPQQLRQIVGRGKLTRRN
jgi:hypothetical protein